MMEGKLYDEIRGLVQEIFPNKGEQETKAIADELMEAASPIAYARSSLDLGIAIATICKKYGIPDC